MDTTLPDVFDRARKLSADERQQLADMLLDTLDDVDQAASDAAWGELAEARWRTHIAAGEVAEDALDAVAAVRRELTSK